eukprot:scaffold1130_cov76-Skeletonema_menzelii.AAC.1
METKDVLIFVAESHRDRGIKLMEEAMKTNSTTDALVAASFLSPQPYKGLLCRELKQSDGEGGGIIIVSESCLGHACTTTCKQPLTQKPTQGYARCSKCRSFAAKGRAKINEAVASATTLTSSPQEKITTIAQHPNRAEAEIPYVF